VRHSFILEIEPNKKRRRSATRRKYALPGSGFNQRMEWSADWRLVNLEDYNEALTVVRSNGGF
jgi:hypothetical protein